MKTMDKCVAKSEEDNNSLFEVLKNSKQLAIRGKQSDSLISVSICSAFELFLSSKLGALSCIVRMDCNGVRNMSKTMTSAGMRARYEFLPMCLADAVD